MSDVVLAALIGAVASIVVNLIATAGQRKKRAIEEAVKEVKLNDRLQSIENKLDTHNGYAEKLTEMDKNLGIITERINNIKEVRT